MNKRSIMITAALLVVGLIVGIGPAQAKNTRTPAKDGPPPTVVRGGYINDASCIKPSNVSLTDDAQAVEFDCTGTSLLTGNFTGRAVYKVRGTMDTAGRISGTLDEVFVGRYAGDKSYGGLLMKGYFEVDENGQFLSRSEIVSGTCAWAGSSGSFDADGTALYGGYVSQWNRPAVTPAADPTCNPLGSFVP